MKKITLWKTVDKGGKIQSCGIQQHGGIVDQEGLEKQGLTLVEKQFEVEFDDMEIYPVKYCPKHGCEMSRLNEFYVCGECIKEMKEVMPEEWRADLEKQEKMLREAFQEHNRKIEERQRRLEDGRDTD